MDLNLHLLVMLLPGVLFGVIGLVALVWALRAGRTQDWEGESRVVFTEEEPEGVVLDRFPATAARKTTFDA
jgi:cbb3-type cytochrome oxidase maturation protein